MKLKIRIFKLTVIVATMLSAIWCTYSLILENFEGFEFDQDAAKSLCLCIWLFAIMLYKMNELRLQNEKDEEELNKSIIEANENIEKEKKRKPGKDETEDDLEGLI